MPDALRFKNEGDLQPNQELGDRQKQADELNPGGSAAGEGCREMNWRWEQVFSLVPLSFSLDFLSFLNQVFHGV